MTIAFFVRSVSRLSASASTSPASAYIRQRMLRVYTSAYVCQPLVCIRVHFPCVGIRQRMLRVHTSAYARSSSALSASCLHPRPLPLRRHTSAYVSIRQRMLCVYTSAYVCQTLCALLASVV
jgi:hypothetical protein